MHRVLLILLLTRWTGCVAVMTGLVRGKEPPNAKRMSARGCEVCREDKVAWSAPLVRGESPTDPYYNVVSRYKGPGAGVDTAPDK